MITKQNKQIYKVLTFAVCVLYLVSANQITVKASTIKGSKLVTGTQKLITDATGALTILSPVVAGLLVGWQAFKLKSAEDEQEEKVIRKKIKTIIIAGVMVFVGSSLVTIILNYYK